MPLYDYRCAVCGHRFELMRSIARRDDAVCEKCGGKGVRVYEGKWNFGAVKGGCGGNCSGCPGCSERQA